LKIADNSGSADCIAGDGSDARGLNFGFFGDIEIRFRRRGPTGVWRRAESITESIEPHGRCPSLCKDVGMRKQS
jgi:hypothetical protein